MLTRFLDFIYTRTCNWEPALSRVDSYTELDVNEIDSTVRNGVDIFAVSSEPPRDIDIASSINLDTLTKDQQDTFHKMLNEESKVFSANDSDVGLSFMGNYRKPLK